MTSEHVSYIVEIKQVVKITNVVTEQFCTKETPTEIMEDGYSHTKKAALAKEFEIRDVTKREVKERQLYRQEVDALNLAGVIEAVNSK